MLTVRPARPRDAELIVNLVKSGFARERRGMLIYGCTGAAEYIRNQIKLPAGLCDTLYFIGEIKRSSAGCIELRRLTDGLFLNLIVTASGLRDKGIGRELLRAALTLAKTENDQRIFLDVFEDNERALRWYKKMGFKKDYRSQWLRVPPTNAGKQGMPSGIIAGYGQAQECQRTLGFSHFTLTTAKGTYTIGRLGTHWFRVTESGLLADRHALACLHVLDRKRNILAIVRDRPSLRLSGGAHPLCRSLRMSMDLGVLMRRLSGLERKE